MINNVIIIIVALILSACDINNPSSFNGKTFIGKGGTTSTSGKWTEFNTSNSYLPSNTIKCVEVDNNNNIWIGTDEGLVFYDEYKWIIYNSKNSSIPSNNINAIICEEDTVWLGMKNNLVKFDGYNWKVYNSKNAPFPDNSEELEFTITSLSVDLKHNIWIGSNYYGIYKFDKKNWISYYPKKDTPISSPSIYSINTDKYGIVWIGHAEPVGIDKFDGNFWTNYNPQNSLFPSWYINDIYTDLENVKWFGTNNGLVKLDNNNWTIYDTTNSVMKDEVILSICSDTKNILWVGTFYGALFSIKNNVWTTYNINDNSKISIPYVSLVCLKTDKLDNKWIGTPDKGLFKFNEDASQKNIK